MRKGLRNSMSQDNCYSLHSERQRRKKARVRVKEKGKMSGIRNGKGHNRSVRVTKGQNVRRTIRVMILEGSRD